MPDYEDTLDLRTLMTAFGSSARRFVLKEAYKVGGKKLVDKVKKDLATMKITFIVHA